MKNEIIRIGQIGNRFLLESAETNGSVAMFEFTVPVGAKVPLPHSHKLYDESIFGVTDQRQWQFMAKRITTLARRGS